MAKARKSKTDEVVEAPVTEAQVEEPVVESETVEEVATEQASVETPEIQPEAEPEAVQEVVEREPEQVAIMVPVDKKVRPMDILRQAAAQAVKNAPAPKQPMVRTVGSMTIRNN